MLVLQRKSEIISPSPIKVSNSFWPVYIPLHTSNLHASELGNDKKKKNKVENSKPNDISFQF